MASKNWTKSLVFTQIFYMIVIIYPLSTVTIQIPDTRIPDSSEYRTVWVSGIQMVYHHFGICGTKMIPQIPKYHLNTEPFNNRTCLDHSNTGMRMKWFRTWVHENITKSALWSRRSNHYAMTPYVWFSDTVQKLDPFGNHNCFHLTSLGL